MKITQLGSEQHLPNGTHKHVLQADRDEMAAKCAAVMDVLIGVTNSPEEGIIILATLLDSIKKECGILEVQILEHPPGEAC